MHVPFSDFLSNFLDAKKAKSTHELALSEYIHYAMKSNCPNDFIRHKFEIKVKNPAQINEAKCDLFSYRFSTTENQTL